MDHEASRIGIVNLILVRQLRMLGMHGKVEAGVFLLLRIGYNIFAILV
jgi:hypothetical protein